MSTAKNRNPVSVEDYLAGENSAKRKHEYVFGEVYAMGGGTLGHSRIAVNVTVQLGSQLTGKPCDVFNSDAKIKITSKAGIRFFYPDVSVVCDSNSDSDLFQERPKVVIEVLSKSTRRLDLGDKKNGYLELPSLDTYVCFEQSKQLAIVFQRNSLGSFDELEYEGEQAIIPLDVIDCQLAFADVYRGVELVDEEDEKDAI